MKKEKHLEIYGGLRDDIEMKRIFTAQWTTRTGVGTVLRLEREACVVNGQMT